MVIAITLIVLLGGGVALAFWLSRRLGESGAETARVLDELLALRNRDVDGRLEAITATMDRRLGELDTKVDRRMEHAAKQTNAIHRQLGAVGGRRGDLVASVSMGRRSGRHRRPVDLCPHVGAGARCDPR
jgi:fermentation-respiration switch protein FrsA (DUF1100 family)